MPYTHFRYIGYQAPTCSSGNAGPADVVAGWDAGAEAPAVPSMPVPDGLPDDARIRLLRLAWVVDAARRRLSQNDMADNDTTLKVFVAPEFYFRPPAAAGAGYTANTYPTSVATQIFGALNQMFASQRYQDWVIVCGTVMWNTSQDAAASTLYYNTAVLVRGGGGVDALHVVEKRVPSNIDGVPVVTDGAMRYYAGPGYDKNVKVYLDSWRNRKRHILDIGGVNIGLEVCLDHSSSDTCKVLRRVACDWFAQEGQENPGVQLHVLTAGGMSVQPVSIAARPNGYLLRSDGMASVNPQVQLVRVTGYTGPLPSDLVAWGPSDLQATAQGTYVTAGAVTMPIAQQGATMPDPPAPYPTMAQQVVFFPAAALP